LGGAGDDFVDQAFARAEVVFDRGDVGPGDRADLTERQARLAMAGENLRRGVEQPLAGLGAGLAPTIVVLGAVGGDQAKNLNTCLTNWQTSGKVKRMLNFIPVIASL
jgi:hypothetical protein